MSLDNTIVKFIRKISRSRGCLRGGESALRRINIFVDNMDYHCEQPDVSMHEGDDMSHSTFNITERRFELSDLDINTDCWVRRLAERFSTTEPTVDEMNKAAECIGILMSEMNFFSTFNVRPRFLTPCIHDTFRYPHEIEHPLKDFRKTYPHEKPGERFVLGDFDEYKIDNFYPALHELVAGHELFPRTYVYRETANQGVQDFIDHAMFHYSCMYARLYSEHNEPCYENQNSVMLMWSVLKQNPDCIGVYGETLIVRKGAPAPTFRSVTRTVTAKYIRTHDAAAVAFFNVDSSIAVSGVIYRDWAYHSAIDPGQDYPYEVVYGFDVQGEFRVIRVKDFKQADKANARYRTRFIFSQMLVGIRLYPFDSYSEYDIDTGYDGVGIDESDILYAMVNYFPHEIQRMFHIIDQGFPIDEVVNAAIEHHVCTTCDCRAQFTKFLDVITAS